MTSHIAIAVVADIHGNLPALEAVVGDIGRRGIDVVINLGDHASGPLWPDETVALLMQRSWVQIAGNCDRQVVHQAPADHGDSDRFAFERLSAAQREWMAACPPTARVLDEILAFHGTPSDDAAYLLEVVDSGRVRLARAAEIEQRLTGALGQVMLCGHSHIPRIVRLGDRFVINPGSVGLPAYTHDRPEAHAMETGSPDARYAVVVRSGRGWQAQLVAVPYDHHAAAERARSNGRPDWEVALRTGYAAS
jgi:predicted phosphodiesterase